MPRGSLRSMVTGQPGWGVVFWVALACVMGLLAPNMTRLAAESQASILGGDAESLGAAEVLRSAWPDQAYESLVVAALHRSSGLTAVDLSYATRLAERILAKDRPKAVIRVLEPGSPAPVAARLRSN